VAASLFKVFIIALSLSLDVFAVSVGVGIRGVPPGMKWRIGIAFACAEVFMNLAGAALGLAAGRVIGPAAAYIGFVALVVLGTYMIYESRSKRTGSQKLDLSKGWGLALASLSISLDSLGIGFSILYIGVPLPISLVTIATFSVASTAAGLALGGRLGGYAERYAAFLGGLLLALTGLAFIALKILRIG
jgi:putative Mn2+ efflux pump MntP